MATEVESVSAASSSELRVCVCAAEAAEDAIVDLAMRVKATRP